MSPRSLGQLGRDAGPIGAALAAVVATALVAAATGFLDPLSFLITVGGALGVTRATYSQKRLVSAWHHLREALAPDVDPEPVIAACKRLARVQRLEGVPALERAAADVPHPFLLRAVRVAVEVDGAEDPTDLLCVEARRAAAEIEEARQVLVTLGRLFPAFGLIGTLIGLALLLRNLSGVQLSHIGPGLGIAVLTTLYGALFANVVVLPLATRLQAHLLRQTLLFEMLIEGALLAVRGEYPSQIDRVLRAHAGIAAPELRRGRPIALAEHAA